MAGQMTELSVELLPKIKPSDSWHHFVRVIMLKSCATTIITWYLPRVFAGTKTACGPAATHEEIGRARLQVIRAERKAHEMTNGELQPKRGRPKKTLSVSTLIPAYTRRRFEEERIELEKAAAELETRRNDLAARAESQLTECKNRLGGWLLKLAEKDPAYHSVCTTIISGMENSDDRDLLNSWLPELASPWSADPPTPATEEKPPQADQEKQPENAATTNQVSPAVLGQDSGSYPQANTSKSADAPAPDAEENPVPPDKEIPLENDATSDPASPPSITAPSNVVPKKRHSPSQDNLLLAPLPKRDPGANSDE
jgi:hypothetical protein